MKKPLLTRILIFIALFILVSFIIGQKIVSSALLYKFNIYIYGGMGYILLFSLIGFFLVYREKLKTLLIPKYKLTDFLLLIASFILISCFYIIELNINKITPSIISIFLIHLLFLLMLILLVFGTFSFNLVKNIFIKFKKEVFYFLIFGIITYSLMAYVWKLWPYLSYLVTYSVYYLLKISTSNVLLISTDTLQVNNFAAKIAEACSGVYSIFLFIALYLFILFLDWKKISKKRAFILFIPAILGAFIINILRVYLIMIFGAFISKEAALGLYHSYSGMIFFLIYFTIFWLLTYKFLKKQKGKISQFYKKIMDDSLYKNSIHIIASTLIMSILGFIFWIIIARLFLAEEVGLATTIISVMGLIASFSLFGLNTGLIRFLPKSERKNDKINTAFTLTALITTIVSVIFLLGITFFSPKLQFIQKNIIESFAFIIFMIFATFNSLIESIFISFRSSKFILIKNSIFSTLKIIFPFFFISLGAYGIFTSWMIALILAFFTSFIILIYKFNYQPKLVFHDYIIKKIGKYSFSNYLAGFIGSLPSLLLPLIITTLLIPEITAYYYISMMIAGLLFAIPNSASNSLFAEGSYNEKNLNQQIKKAVKIISLLLIPGILIILLAGNYILLAFGHQYSTEAFRFLQVLSISGIFVAINSIFSSVFKVEKRIISLIIRNILTAGIILTLSLFFILNDFGLLGIGYAWIIGQAISALFFILVRKK